MHERTQTPAQREFYFPSEWFDVAQINQNLWAIREPHHREDVISYYVRGSARNVLIDSGMGLADIRKVIPAGKSPLLLLSHSHWDHMGGASDFSSVAVFDDPVEQDRVGTGWQPEEMEGFEAENFIGVEIPPSFSKDTFSVPGVPVLMTLEDDQVIDLGSDRLRVIHTPGHTSGSVCFYLENEGLLFTGDTLYPGPEYLHMKGSNPKDYFASLEQLLKITQGKLKTIHPGHNATNSSPDLLTRHVLAARGALPVLEQEDGVDNFGPYTKLSYGDFSFMLPVEVTLESIANKTNTDVLVNP